MTTPDEEVDQPVADTNADETTEANEESTEKEEGAENEDDQETGEEATEENEEDDSEDDEEVAQEQVQAKRGGRAQERIRRQSEELKTERAEKERLIADRAVALAQLENLRMQQQQMLSSEQRRAEEERLKLLAPEERQLYTANQQIRELHHRINQMDAQRSQDLDRVSFQSKAAQNPTYARYADEVEAMYQDGLKRGVVAPREDLLYYALGKSLAKDMGKKADAKKQAASKRIDSATAKPTRGKSDVAGSRKGASVEDRLRDVQI